MHIYYSVVSKFKIWWHFIIAFLGFLVVLEEMLCKFQCKGVPNKKYTAVFDTHFIKSFQLIFVDDLFYPNSMFILIYRVF